MSKNPFGNRPSPPRAGFFTGSKFAVEQQVQTTLGPACVVMLGRYRRHVVRLSRQNMLIELSESQIQPTNITQPA